MIILSSFTFVCVKYQATYKGVGRKISKGGGTIERPIPRNVTNKPFYQWLVRGRSGHVPMAHLKKTLYQKLRVKSEGLFWRNTYFRENAHLFRKFQAILVRKTLNTGLT